MMLKLVKIALLPFLFIQLSSCVDKKAGDEKETTQKPLFELVPATITSISFNNHIEENDKFNMVDFFYVYNGGGVAIGDINNDGLPDIYFSGNMVGDRLYLNKGGLNFEDISDSAGIVIPGWSTGVTMVDVNHDGLLDIYVCRSGNFNKDKRKNLLYVNQGNLKFEEQAETYGIADTGYSTQAAFFDYDKDGDLDMYLLNHTNEIRDPNNVRPLVKDGTGPANDKLYRNEESRGKRIRFTEVGKQAGIVYDGLGLGLGIADVNGDGWEDILVTNDFISNDYLYINKKDGTFEEMSKTYLDHVSHFSMGNDIADFNNDGLEDIVTMDMRPRDNFHEKKMSGPLNFDLFERTLQQGYMPQYMRNTLQINNGTSLNGHPSFSEVGQLLNIDATDWSWAPLFADFDNDGFKDLYVTNGYLRDITDLDFINYTGSLSANVSKDSLDYVLKQKAREMPSIKLSNFLFKNRGDLSFEDVTEKWGLQIPSLSNGAAYADLDNDGDLDIVVNNINEAAFLFENKSNVVLENHYLNIHLKGDSLNPIGLGTQVSLFQKGKQQTVRQALTRGYQSSVDKIVHFGLGDTEMIDSILVSWPDGAVGKVLNPLPDREITISRDEASEDLASKNTVGNSSLFREISTNLKLDHLHEDKVYYDFNRQFLLPHKHSNQGPGLAVGDINNDGRDDFFVGGGYNSSGTLFYGTADGTFRKELLTPNENEKYEEDTGVLFFDYDGDGDQDLYVTSGSNEFYEGSEYYQDRLYANDGQGNFSLDKQALPKIVASGSCVRAADFDKDGDLDLFIGGRLTPLKYPLPPNSYLLENNNGKFTDATNKLAPSIRKVGMVTDALWTDYDLDGDTDLIVVGEFMAIQFFENQNAKLVNSSGKIGLTYTSGWWNSINGGDFDNDGDMDYILGNIGLNTKYSVSANEPLTVYAMDYDNNGSLDPIMSSYNNGNEYPVHSRDDLIKQIPQMKKKFPDYDSYAHATMADVLSNQEKASSYIAKAFLFASVYLQNNGNGKFEIKSLPMQAQIAPVYGILINDYDRDGYLDVLLSGNNYGTEVGVGRHDASKGVFLKGDGKGHFKSVPSRESGLWLNGDNRGAVSIKVNDRQAYLFGRNSNGPKVYVSEVQPTKGTFMDVLPNVAKAIITYKDGKIRLQEFYYGSSYLSQSSRTLFLYGEEDKVVFYDYLGNEVAVNEL
ncbi:RNA-binding protein [Arenibacter aquaticus]|uniref:RNA-binding protein n=1 Tax=Arenibacter aquaticus TaxID=2489054 RepID=A0A430K574_9FLAO|nr:VCBS repeat-containing protein [Arenibacter aquaticus]RTE54184.1 RNA-binding protein [Arenibacter aquaticus]